MPSACTEEARAGRDAAFSALGRPVLIDPEGAATRVMAIASAGSVTEQIGAFEAVQHGRFFRFKAEEAPPRGAVLAVLDEITGAEVERRRVQGDPAFADRRRLVVEIDTAPA